MLVPYYHMNCYSKVIVVLPANKKQQTIQEGFPRNDDNARDDLMQLYIFDWVMFYFCHQFDSNKHF